MNLLTRFFRRVEAPPVLVPDPQAGPRIAVFGDSHTAAMQAAKDYPDRAHVYEHIDIYRVRKDKDGRAVGDTSLAEFCDVIRGFSERDFVFSAVGGNQYAVVSTVRSPVEYDFLMSADDEEFASGQAVIVPFRALARYIEKGIRGTVGPVLGEMRQSTRARIFHLASPPPKQNNQFIATHFESRFAKQGLADFGPTRPELRLKCWKVQLNCLAKLCEELGVELVVPPWRAVDDDGYLQERCYAKDVTHGNRRYGEYVLKDVLQMTGTAGRAEAQTQ